MTPQIERRSPGSQLTKLAPVLLIAGLVVVHGIINWLWLADNEILGGADRAGHLARSMRYHLMLSPPTLRGLFDVMVAHPVRPSLFHITASPAYGLLGLSEDAGPMINLLYLTVLLAATYGLGVKLRGRKAGLLATALVGTYPMIFAMSRYFYMEFALTAMVTATIYFLVASDGFQRRTPSVLFGLCLGLGLLTKRTYVAFVLVPAMYVVLRAKLLPVLWRRLAGRPHIHWRGLIIAIAGGGLLASLWFFPNRETVSELVLGNWLLPIWWFLAAATIYLLLLPSSPEGNMLASVALGASVASLWYLARIEFIQRATSFAYGDLAPEGRVFNWLDLSTYDYYLRWIVIENISPFYAVFALLAAAVLITTWIRKRPRISPVWWVLVCWLAGSYVLMTLSLYRQSRAILPILPAIALLTAGGLLMLPWKHLRRALVSIMLVGGVLQLVFLSFTPFQPVVSAVNDGPLAAFARGTHILWPDYGATDPAWAINDDLLAHADAARRSKNADIQRLGLLANSPYLNATQFQPLIVSAYPNLAVKSLTRSSTRGGSAYQDLFDYDLIVLKEENRFVLEEEQALIDRLLHDPPLAFSEAYVLEQTYPLPDGDAVYLYGRRPVGMLADEMPETAYVSDLIADLEGTVRPGDAILIDTAAMLVPLARGLGVAPSFYLWPLSDEDLSGIASRHQRIFVVDWEGVPSDYAWLDHNAHRAGGQWFGDIQVIAYGPAATLSEQRSGARFGEEISLARYALPTQSPAPGDVLPMRLTWQASNAPAGRFKFFAHLLDEDGHLVAQHDGEPVGGLWPTSEWSAGEVIDDLWGVLLPGDLPAGNYTLVAGWYPAEGGDRLPVVSGAGEPLGTELELGTLQIGQRP